MKAQRVVAANGLDSFFQPHSVALIGASDDPDKIGGRPLHYLLNLGYQGLIYPINPNRSVVQGVSALQSIADLPDNVDLAIIAVPADRVVATIHECGERGIGSVIVFSAGFSEAGVVGAALEAEVVRAALQHNIRIVGPNSLGIISQASHLAATFSSSLQRPDAMRAGSISLLTQSGALGAFIYSLASDQGLGIRHFVSLGNEADLEISDFLRFLIDDDGTRVIVGYLEGIRNGEAFTNALEAARVKGKAVGFVKVGRTKLSQEAAASHTGAHAGSNAIYDAVFKQFGVQRFEGIQELIDFAGLAAQVVEPPRQGVAVASISGGAAAWLADAFAMRGVQLTALQAGTVETLKGLLPTFATAHNPVDFTPQVIGHPGLLRACVRAVLDDPGIDCLVIVLGLQERGGEGLAAELVAAAQETTKAVVVTWLVGPARAYEILSAAAVPTFFDLSRCVSAVAGLVRYGRSMLRSEQPEVHVLPAPGAAPVRSHVNRADARNEHASKSQLRELGIRIPEGALASSVEEALDIARRIGYPVVAKAMVDGITHKTDYGLVQTNVCSDAELRDAFARLTGASAALTGEDRRPVILVEEMLRGGLEVVVGVLHDPTFGAVTSLGRGGLAVDENPLSFRVGPLSRDDAAAFVAESGVSQHLSGFRGSPPLDREALIDCIYKLAGFARANADRIADVEVNPLLLMPEGKGAVALDALIVMRDQEEIQAISASGMAD